MQIIYVILLISMSVELLFLDFAHQHQPMDLEYSHHWDLLFLVQRWPVTACQIYIDNRTDRHCNFPKNKEMWTVHGFWPLRLGTLFPTLCNNTLPFDRDQVKPLESELEEHWTNTKNGEDNYSFWEYEWVNHGTCGTTLEALNTQYKYFKKGIELNKQYPIFDMLTEANIHPDDTKEVTVEELSNAIKAKIGKSPVSFCEFQTGTQYLKELCICFDKELKLVDCDGVIVIHGILTVCDVSQGIIYPKNYMQVEAPSVL